MITAPPSDVFDLVQRACELEVLATKAGNVFPGRSFTDTSAADFLLSARLLKATWSRHPDAQVGAWILKAVEEVKQQVGKNTNLGIVLLLAPLTKAVQLHQRDTCRARQPVGLLPSHTVLAQLNQDDADYVYRAIRLANPGGLGAADQHDINSSPPPCLISAMQLAADYDDVARQYVTNFADVYELAQQLNVRLCQAQDCLHAISELQIDWLARRIDTLIARKCGRAIAQEVRLRAQVVQSSGPAGSAAYQSAWEAFDRFLRSDGNRLNPGTTADLLAAAIFICLYQMSGEHDTATIPC